jgi:general secretion pathway protein F
MAAFAYRAVDRTGRSSSGEVEARDRPAAVGAVRAMGVTPVEVIEVKGRVQKPTAIGGARGKAEVTKALGELGVLLNAGLPMDRALTLCVDNVENAAVAAEFKRLQTAVRQGSALSGVMAERPDLFAPSARAIVEAGEANGRIGDALSRVARMLEQAEGLRRLVVSAMIYPMALMLLAVAVILMMLLYVVPQFESLFATAQDKLPASSIALMAASRLLRDHGLILAGLAVAAVFGIRTALPQKGVVVAIDRLILQVPQIGTLVRYIEAARLARTLGGLVEGGVPLPQALAMSVRAIANGTISSAVAGVAEEVKKGGALTQRLAATGVLPRMAIGFIRTGEETSQLGMMLERLAEVLERDVTLRIERLVAIVTPLITVMLGGAVAAIIASIMTAILGFNDLAVNP